MTATLVDQPPTDYQELAKRVRSHRFVDGPTRKLVRSWIQHDPPPAQIPWIPLAKPLHDSRVALVSSAGIARHDQPPFDQELERRDPWWSDQSWRPIPTGTTEADVGIYHLHILAHSAVALFAASASTCRFLLLVKPMRTLVLHVVAAL